MHSPIIVLAGFGEGGKLPTLISDENKLPDLPTKPKIGWIHVIAKDVTAAQYELVSKYGLRDLEVALSLDPTQTADIHDHNDVLFVEVPMVTRMGNSEQYSEIGIFLTKSWLISISIDDDPIVRKRFSQWMLEPLPGKEVAAGILYGLLDSIVDSYFPIADAMQEEMSDIEDRLYDGTTDQIREALEHKRRLLLLRRKIAPVRDVVNSLLRRNHDLIPSKLWPYFHDLFEQVARTLDLIDLSRDMLSSMLDAHLTIASNRLNEVMKFLAVISTILMSISVISGVYGMNFKYMPELLQTWGYPATLGLMVFVSFMEYLFFRRKGWI